MGVTDQTRQIHSEKTPTNTPLMNYSQQRPLPPGSHISQLVEQAPDVGLNTALEV